MCVCVCVSIIILILHLSVTSQPLGNRSAYNTIIEDPGSPYVATFQCIIYFLFTSLVFYRLYLWYISFLRFLTKTNRKKNSFAVQ